MNIIKHAAPPAQPTTTFQLEERNAVNDERTTIDTADSRDSALASFDEHLRQHPVRYRPWTAYRLVLVEGGAR